VRARAVGGYWLDAAEQRRERLEREAAVWLLEAHLRSEEAEGVARAVRLALSGETWTPYDHHREADALFSARNGTQPERDPRNRRARVIIAMLRGATLIGAEPDHRQLTGAWPISCGR